MNLRSPIWLLVIFFFVEVNSFAQVARNFIHYTSEQGLTSNAVTSVIQDKWGYLWIGTSNGLNKYDGNYFQQFKSGSSHHSLPEDNITELVQLGEDQIGAYTSMGLHIIDCKKGTTRNIIIPPGELKYAYKVNNIMGALSGKNGDVYVLTRSGFYHFNNKDELIYRFDYYNGSDAETKAFGFGSELLQLSEERLLLLTLDGLYKYDIGKKECSPLKKEDEALLAAFVKPAKVDYVLRQIEPGRLLFLKAYSDSIIYIDLKKRIKTYSTAPIKPLISEFGWRSNLFFQNDSSIFITGREKGYFKMSLDPGTHKIILSAEKRYEELFCSSIHIDRDNRLWVGTAGGLYKQALGKNIVQVSVPDSTGIHAEKVNIQQVFVFRDKVYAGSRGGGLQVHDKNTLLPLKLIHFIRADGIRAGVQSIAHLNDDTLSITTNGPVYYFKTSNGKYGELKFSGWPSPGWGPAQFIDKDSNLWLTTNSDNKIFFYDRSSHHFISKPLDGNIHEKILAPMHVSEDNEGNLWMGGHGLFRYNKKDGNYDFAIDSFPKLRFMRKEIDALTIDGNNVIWFGNVNNGLIGYDIQKKTFEHFSREDGLPENRVIALKVIGQKLWIATPAGIACLDLKTRKIAAFGRDDGFPAATVTGQVFFYDGHELYTAFEERIVRFHPDSLQQSNKAPEFFIEYVGLGKDTTIFHPTDQVRTRYMHNDISLFVGGSNYNDYNNQRFAYRLNQEKDTSWKILNQQSGINFNNLSPGNYQLSIKTYSANNRWPEQVQHLNILVLPPFWQTWWFLSACALVLIFLAYQYFVQKIRSVRKKSGIDKQLAELEMKGLHAQMNPHFIFNSLNSIKDMILHDEKDNASRYLSKFAQMIRLNLEHSQQTFITLQENIDYLRHYLGMEQLRFTDFHFEIEADPAIKTKETLLPPMLLQPLVENAIWHGLLPKQGEKKLNLRFQKANDALVCEIEDNGVGINYSLKTKSHNLNRSMGIENIRRRLKVLNEKYKLHYLLTITDKKEMLAANGTGTIATLAVPIENA